MNNLYVPVTLLFLNFFNLYRPAFNLYPTALLICCGTLNYPAYERTKSPILMLSTIMYRFRTIAPLIISTLYNGVWSDSRSGHFTKCTSWIAIFSPTYIIIHFADFFISSKTRWTFISFLRNHLACCVVSFIVSTISYVNRLQRRASFTLWSVAAKRDYVTTVRIWKNVNCKRFL
jgi:predicted membrane channel-forming protein YqfA (hemolysin III family)